MALKVQKNNKEEKDDRPVFNSVAVSPLLEELLDRLRSDFQSENIYQALSSNVIQSQSCQSIKRVSCALFKGNERMALAKNLCAHLGLIEYGTDEEFLYAIEDDMMIMEGGLAFVDSVLGALKKSNLENSSTVTVLRRYNFVAGLFYCSGQNMISLQGQDSFNEACEILGISTNEKNLKNKFSKNKEMISYADFLSIWAGNERLANRKRKWAS